MAVQAVHDQRSRQRTAAYDVLTHPDAPRPDQAQQDQEQAATSLATVAVPSFSVGMVVFVGVGAVTAAALIGIGLSRRRIVSAIRALRYKAEDIQIPLILPMMVGETVWEVLATRRLASQIAATNRQP